jgi:hypothetical protein
MWLKRSGSAALGLGAKSGVAVKTEGKAYYYYLF